MCHNRLQRYAKIIRIVGLRNKDLKTNAHHVHLKLQTLWFALCQVDFTSGEPCERVPYSHLLSALKWLDNFFLFNTLDTKVGKAANCTHICTKRRKRKEVHENNLKSSKINWNCSTTLTFLNRIFWRNPSPSSADGSWIATDWSTSRTRHWRCPWTWTKCF